MHFIFKLILITMIMCGFQSTLFGQNHLLDNIEFKLIKKTAGLEKSLMTDYLGKPIGSYKPKGGRVKVIFFNGQEVDLPSFSNIDVNFEKDRIVIFKRVEKIILGLVNHYFLEIYNTKGELLFTDFTPTVSGFISPKFKISSEGNIFIFGVHDDESKDEEYMAVAKYNSNGKLQWRNKISDNLLFNDFEISDNESAIGLLARYHSVNKMQNLFILFDKNGVEKSRRELKSFFRHIYLLEENTVVLVSAILKIELSLSLEEEVLGNNIIEKENLNICSVGYFLDKDLTINLNRENHKSNKIKICSLSKNNGICSREIFLSNEFGVGLIDGFYLDQDKKIIQLFSKGVLYDIMIEGI